jgi:hypothetical protein
MLVIKCHINEELGCKYEFGMLLLQALKKKRKRLFCNK